MSLRRQNYAVSFEDVLGSSLHTLFTMLYPLAGARWGCSALCGELAVGDWRPWLASPVSEDVAG